MRDARRWLVSALASEGPPTTARGRAFASLGVCADALGDFGAAEIAADEALRIASLTGDDLTRARALDVLAWVRFAGGENEVATEIANEALAAAERSGDHNAIRRVRVTFANLLAYLGRLDEARMQLEAELADVLEIGDEMNAAAIHSNLAVIELTRGDYARSQHRCRLLRSAAASATTGPRTTSSFCSDSRRSPRETPWRPRSLRRSTRMREANGRLKSGQGQRMGDRSYGMERRR